MNDRNANKTHWFLWPSSEFRTIRMSKRLSNACNHLQESNYQTCWKLIIYWIELKQVKQSPYNALKLKTHLWTGGEKWSFIKSFEVFKLFLMNFTINDSIMHELGNAKNALKLVCLSVVEHVMKFPLWLMNNNHVIFTVWQFLIDFPRSLANVTEGDEKQFKVFFHMCFLWAFFVVAVC